MEHTSTNLLAAKFKQVAKQINAHRILCDQKHQCVDLQHVKGTIVKIKCQCPI
jgi:hypothetical protein